MTIRVKQVGVAAVCAALAGLSMAGTDWNVLNERARRHAAEPVRAGLPGRVPFWNVKSRAFIHPPAFDFKPVRGATAYRFSVTEKETGKVRTFVADRPWAPLTPVWDDIPPCYVHVRVEGVDASGKALGVSGERDCYRAAVFRGPYPEPKSRDYAAAAGRCYAAIFRLGHVQAWLRQNEPSPNYDLYCYPSKLVSSIVVALLRHAEFAPSDGEKAVTIARKMADWLISVSQPAGTPLEHLPPTYWGNRRQEAVRYAGQNMLIYPTCAAAAYFRLFDKTKDARYREAGLNIVRTMDRLRLDNGTWWIKVSEKDGKPVCKNLLVPCEHVFEMYDLAAKLPGCEKYAAYRTQLEKYIYKSAFKTWNWEGQFEDGDLRPPYHNLQKGTACEFATWLFAHGRLTEAKELLDWSEDQFVAWSDPIHHMDWKNWKTPTALEQYDYYTPIDASMADLVGGFTAAWRATDDELYLEKARAMADCILRHQRADGTIPTYFDSRPGSDWVNCMVYTSSFLEKLDRAIRERATEDGAVKNEGETCR